jgi:hypothetical protein
MRGNCKRHTVFRSGSNLNVHLIEGRHLVVVPLFRSRYILVQRPAIMTAAFPAVICSLQVDVKLRVLP